MSDTDIHRRLSDLVDARPLDVEERLRSLHNGRRTSRSKRALTIVVALGVALVGVVIVVRAFTRPADRRAPAAAPEPAGAIVFTHALEESPAHPTFEGDVYVVNADGSSRGPLLQTPDTEFLPVWSPDGTRVASVQMPATGGRAGLVVMNADGTDPRSVTEGVSVESFAWSPDGTRIAFIASDGGLYVVNSEGGEPGRILSGSWRQVSWSPDGRRLLLSGFPADPEQAGHADIYSIGADGRDLAQLTDDAAEDQWPSWSPDGARIAFQRLDFRDHDVDIYVMAADGSGLMRLTDWRGLDALPVWSPDGEWVAFASDRAARPDQISLNAEGGNATGVAIWMMRADGTEPRPLTQNDGDWVDYPSSWRALPV